MNKIQKIICEIKTFFLQINDLIHITLIFRLIKVMCVKYTCTPVKYLYIILLSV